MNKVILAGRLTRDPDVRINGENKITRYSLAVDRRFKREGDPSADFINCVTFGKNADFADKYLKKGVKVIVTGRIQTGSYTKQDGTKIYTTDIVVEEHEFAESKSSAQQSNTSAPQQTQSTPKDDFMSIPEIPDNSEELPFS